MLSGHKSALLVVATVVVYAAMIQQADAKGGGHGGGGHHGGGHHAGHHGGGHNHHPYHPSHHHASHHEHHGDHHHDHHYAHHHSDWHRGGWGPGFWGGAALGYGLGYGYGNWDGYGYGGDTYVDNSTNVTSADTNDDAYAASQPSGAANAGGFPTDAWPELGIVTYAGQYGNAQGQVIVRVIPGSAAERAGLVPGDVILTFNGQPVPSAAALDAALGDATGGKFEAQVWDARTGRKSTLSGQLDAAAPQPSETAAMQP